MEKRTPSVRGLSGAIFVPFGEKNAGEHNKIRKTIAKILSNNFRKTEQFEQSLRKSCE
jgi:hypothetical protein